MIVNKDIQDKIETIANKMSLLGFGTKQECYNEMLDKFVQKELLKLKK